MGNRDWENPANYPDPNTTSPDRWAFEFLRRNPKFVGELNAALEKDAEIDRNGGVSERYVMHVLRDWGVDHISLHGWGSATDIPLRMEVFPREVGYSEIDGKPARVTCSLSNRYVLEFSLTESPIRQIKLASAMLRAKQKDFDGPKRTQERNATRLFPLYLRVLDMRAAKLSKARMLEILSADMPEGIGDDDIRNWIKAAEALRDGGYRNIAQNATR